MLQRYLSYDVASYGYDYVGWNSFRGNADGRVSRDYATKLACAARNADCRTNALQAYGDYLRDPYVQRQSTNQI